MDNNREIVDYELVTANNYGILAERVRRKIDDCWQPFGNVQMHISENPSGFEDLYFVQAVVKYKKENNY